MNQTVVLVGAGHAHLHIVAHARAFTSRGVRLILVDPGTFWYSGLATGMLSGRYDPSEDQIDVAKLASRFGAEFVAGRVVEIDRVEKRVVLDSGGVLTYDLLSLNIGSRVSPLELPDDGTVRTFRAKPISQLAELHQVLAGHVAQFGEMPAVGVIGGGVGAGRPTQEGGSTKNGPDLRPGFEVIGRRVEWPGRLFLSTRKLQKRTTMEVAP